MSEIETRRREKGKGKVVCCKPCSIIESIPSNCQAAVGLDVKDEDIKILR